MRRRPPHLPGHRTSNVRLKSGAPSRIKARSSPVCRRAAPRTRCHRWPPSWSTAPASARSGSGSPASLQAHHDFYGRAGGPHAAPRCRLASATSRTRGHASVDGALPRADVAGDTAQPRIANAAGAAGDPRLAALGAALSVVRGAAGAIAACVTGEPTGRAAPARPSAACHGAEPTGAARASAPTRSERASGPGDASAPRDTSGPRDASGRGGASGAGERAPVCHRFLKVACRAQPGPGALVADVRLGRLRTEARTANAGRWIGVLWTRDKDDSATGLRRNARATRSPRRAAPTADHEEKRNEPKQGAAPGQLAAFIHPPTLKQERALTQAHPPRSARRSRGSAPARALPAFRRATA